jgi:hypothetical protein
MAGSGGGRQVVPGTMMMTSLTLFEVALFPTSKSVFLQEILMSPDPNMLFCSMPKSQSVRIPWENVKKNSATSKLTLRVTS